MKKVLLLSYYFPPSGGAGVQRWLKFISYLPEYGWLPTVITTSEGDYPVLDSSLCKKIPDQVQVIRTNTPTFNKLIGMVNTENDSKYPYGSLRTADSDPITKKILYWLRLNMIVPDSRVIWNKIAYKAALEELRKKKYDLVVTTGPPHSTHLIALELKKKFPIKWIADFRDPWTKIYYLQEISQNKLIQKMNRKYESAVVEKADLNIIISQSIADTLPAGNKVVLSNGYDPEDFFNIEEVPAPFFRIKYIGKLTEGQDIKKPLQWLNETSKERKIGNIEFSFIGTLGEAAKQERVLPHLHIRNIGYITHIKALNEMANADILLLLINKCPENKGILTTKLFEYIGSKTFILGIGPTDGEAAQFLEKYKAGKMVEYDDREGFIQTVSDLYAHWIKGKNTKNRENIDPLSTPEQARELSGIFDQITTDN